MLQFVGVGGARMAESPTCNRLYPRPSAFSPATRLRKILALTPRTDGYGRVPRRLGQGSRPDLRGRDGRGLPGAVRPRSRRRGRRSGGRRDAVAVLGTRVRAAGTRSGRHRRGDRLVRVEQLVDRDVRVVRRLLVQLFVDLVAAIVTTGDGLHRPQVGVQVKEDEVASAGAVVDPAIDPEAGIIALFDDQELIPRDERQPVELVFNPTAHGPAHIFCKVSTPIGITYGA